MISDKFTGKNKMAYKMLHRNIQEGDAMFEDSTRTFTSGDTGKEYLVVLIDTNLEDNNQNEIKVIRW